MDLTTVITDLAGRLRDLDRWHSMIWKREKPGIVSEAACRRSAAGIAEALELRLPEVLPVLHVLVNEAELLDDRFWRTPLGRMMFAVPGGYAPDSTTIGQSYAALVLGYSRQRISQLIAGGVLTRASSSMVPVGEVRKLLIERLDILVK